MFEKNGIAILLPDEYSKLRDAGEKEEKVLMDIALFTGMRYTELLKLQDNPSWFMRGRKCIELPESADKKKKRKNRGRYVMLSSYGTFVLEHYFEDEKRPAFHSSLPKWDMRLKKYAKKIGLVENGKSVANKSFRKTWESWLAVTYPDRVGLICQSQGHTEIISMQHYTSIPFTSSEKEQIKEKVGGWL